MYTDKVSLYIEYFIICYLESNKINILEERNVLWERESINFTFGFEISIEIFLINKNKIGKNRWKRYFESSNE